MKTGTSWLHEYFVDHPDVSVPTTVKETYFFSRHYEKGYDWYIKQFKDTNDLKLAGEVGPTYFPDRESMLRLKKLNPNLKIIITLREPTDRFLSHYRHLVDGGLITELEDSYAKTFDKRRLLREHSCYFTFINEWTKHFGRSNLQILFYEDLKNEPQLFADMCCNFLELETFPVPIRLTTRIGARRKPKNPGLIKLVKRAAKWLRGKDYHRIINTIKALGIERVLYNNKSSTRAHTHDTRENQTKHLFQKMRNEIFPLEADLHISIEQWKELWSKKNFDA